MSNDGVTSPTGLRRIWVVVVAVLVVAALASAATAALRGPRSPESHEQADAGRSDQPVTGDSTNSTAGPSAAPTGIPEASPTPTATTATATAPAVAPAPRQSTLVPKPRVTSFSATADGLIVTVTFTFDAQADRGPFTCIVQPDLTQIDSFPCGIGRVSRTYDLWSCCRTRMFITVSDRYNVRSDQWSGWVEYPKPAQPTYQNLRGWSDHGTVHVAFDVVSAPGDDPVCDIDIYHHPSGYHLQRYSHPCEGTTTISFDGDGGLCLVYINIRSDTYRFTEGSSQTIQIE